MEHPRHCQVYCVINLFAVVNLFVLVILEAEVGAMRGEADEEVAGIDLDLRYLVGEDTGVTEMTPTLTAVLVYLVSV